MGTGIRGVETIEHGDEGTPEIWKLMVEKGVAYCPTLAAPDATAQYAGWRKGVDPEPERIASKRQTFKAALSAGVKMCFGGDVGVYAHGDYVRELELMVQWGVTPLAHDRRHLRQRRVLPPRHPTGPREGGPPRGSDRRPGRSDLRHRCASTRQVLDEGREDVLAAVVHSCPSVVVNRDRPRVTARRRLAPA